MPVKLLLSWAFAAVLLGAPTALAQTPIHDVQGRGVRSPLTGQTVTVRGIVTARRASGFYLQARDGEADTDPGTSEGILVFTSSAPPDTAAVGTDLTVTGTVTEFIPSSDAGSPSLTELTSPRNYLAHSTGNALPAPVEITPSETSPSGIIEQLEHLEGMRVRVSSLTVCGPTLGSQSASNEVSATAAGNGVFYAVVTGVARPFREPGIPANDPAPSGSIPPIPRFDANPERLRVDSDGQTGARALDVTAGTVIEGMTGVLDYGSRAYTILPDPGAELTLTGGLTSARAPARPDPDEVTVATFNTERFFDDVNDPVKSEPVLTQQAFAGRLRKASKLIREVLHSPDIIALEEVENLATLKAIATRISADAIAAGVPDPTYAAYLEEGNDPGGIDIGFLVKTVALANQSPRVTIVSVEQIGKNEIFAVDGSLLNDRPPLVLRAVVALPSGGSFPLTVIANHLRSLNDITDPSSGDRVRQKRRAQAEYVAKLVQERQAADAAENIIVLGDLNAYPFNDGLVDVVGTILGRPAGAGQAVLTSPDLVEPDLTNLLETLPPLERYSYVFDGNAQAIDHILVNEALVAATSHRRLAFARVNADFPEGPVPRADFSRPERLSDHDPAVAYFLPRPKSHDAELFLPIVLDVEGFGGARYQTEVTLANRGAAPARVNLVYTAAEALHATGTGVASLDLAPGQQRTIPDAIAFLRGQGLPIPPEAPQGGTLRCLFSGVESPDAVFAGARTTAPAGAGRAGLAYSALPVGSLSAASVNLFGLRQNDSDRTNLALTNAGKRSSITLSVTVSLGVGEGTPDFEIGSFVLAPGQWMQLDRVLSRTPFSSGLATVTRVEGTEPFLAYAVINDNTTNDGSFVPAVPSELTASSHVLPALVETSKFKSELVLGTNSQNVEAVVSYVESLAFPPGTEASTPVKFSMRGVRQLILADALEEIRKAGGAGPAGPDRAGALRIEFQTPDGQRVPGVAGARTSAPDPAGGAFGLFYAAVPAGQMATTTAYVHGLRQDDTSRSNLALVNAGEAEITLEVFVHDGPTGAEKGRAGTYRLPPGGWKQLNLVLQPFGVSEGWARVTRTAGSGPFVTYGVVNDGRDVDSGTSDGTYLEMTGFAGTPAK
ncbi:MAG: hypothetical protein DIJKHBIC_00166 [Thermoanaerobaculia bacterium]|nr:hypothetical protein [Thermoanaerobaculia bacterium]